LAAWILDKAIGKAPKVGECAQSLADKPLYDISVLHIGDNRFPETPNAKKHQQDDAAKTRAFIGARRSSCS